MYNTNSDAELGTMKCSQERIMRHSVNKDVKQHYDADKDFFISFFNAYIIEAAIEFFGLEMRNSIPTKHTPPPFVSREESLSWLQNTLGSLIDEMVFPAWNGHTVENHETEGLYALHYM